MVDLARVNQRLTIIRENVESLREMRSLSVDQLRGNRRDLAAAKHFLRESIEAMIDLAGHIAVKQLLGTPASSVDAIILLRDKGVFPSDHAATYVKMVKYRNRLVHFYSEVTVEELWDLVQNRLPDLELFVADISSYVGGPSCSPNS